MEHQSTSAKAVPATGGPTGRLRTAAAPLPARTGFAGLRLGVPELAFVALTVLAVAGWAVLYRWYALADRYDFPYFAFEKIRGGQGEAVLSPPLRWTEVIFLALGVGYAVGFVLLARLRTVTLPIKVATVLAGLGPGIVNVGLFPAGALDVFRYMVALKQYYFYHENPYIQGFMHHQDDPFAEHAFLLHLPNAKGPVWLLFSAIPSYLAGFEDPVRFLVALKLFNLVLIGLTAWTIARAQPDARRWPAAYLFWANPLVLFEGVANVHNDVMVALFLVGALIALRGRSWLAFPLLALSALVKYFTFQLGPLFLLVMLVRRWPLRTIAISAVAGLAVAAASIAPFWADGRMREGIDSVGVAYERSAHVSISSLVRQYRQRGLSREEASQVPTERPLFAAVFAVLSLPVLWRARRGNGLERATLDLYLLFILLLSLLYPWYLIPVVALIALRHDPLDLSFLFVATTLGLAYYPAYVWAHFGSGYPIFGRHLFLALFVTAPILAYLMLQAGRVALGRVASRPGAGPGTSPTP